AGAPLKNAQSRPDDADAFVTKINTAGSAWLYSTYLGGGEEEHGLGIAVDGQGHAYVAGDTRSGDFPVASALRGAPPNSQGGAGAPDAFVSKLAPTGSTLVYSTYLGGGGLDQAAAVAVDAAGHAFVTGNTGSDDFPVADAAQSARRGDSDAFISKLSPTGSALVYSTYLGGRGSDTATDIAVDNEGRASVTGSLTSTDLRTVDAVQTRPGGGFLDGFVATLDASGSEVVRSSYLGGRDSDQGLAIAVDFDGTLALAGLTSSSDFPIAGALQQSTGGGAGDAFVSRLGRPVAGAANPTGAPGSDGRAQVLLVTTVGLLLIAVVQSLWLRRRPAPDVPGQMPTPAHVPEAAATPEDQAAWIAKADQAVRATGFPSVQVPQPPAPAPFRTRRRRAAVDDGGPLTAEVPVPDLLAGEDDEDVADEWRPAETAREEAFTGAGGAPAKAPAVDLSDPDLLGASEPEPELPSDPAWWDLLIEDESNARSPAPAPPDPRPPAETPVAAPDGGTADDDWAADLWTAGMVAEAATPSSSAGPPPDAAAPPPAGVADQTAAGAAPTPPALTPPPPTPPAPAVSTPPAPAPP
ncbi:MAG TPA: SBBP repeat-containing protein, partial [Acidimicrobiales bacterium]|nr:SBBP repeat-containing protein [Acidimicrobiales bacterium]